MNEEIDITKCKYIDIENFEEPMCNCILDRNEIKRHCKDNLSCYYKQLQVLQNKLADIYMLCNKPDRYGNVCANDILQLIEGNKNG